MSKKKHKRYGDGLRHLSIKTLEQWYKEPVDSPGDYYLQCEVERVLVHKSKKWRKKLGEYHLKPWKRERNFQKKVSEQKKKNREKKLKVNYKLRTVKVVVETDARFGPMYEYQDEWYPTCPNCGASIFNSYQYCPNCGCGLIWVKAPPLPVVDPEYEKEQERKRVEAFNQFKLLIKELNDLHDDEGDSNE